jgi:4-oxalmesaconate hydratase
MIIDCHGHFTTVPAAHARWRRDQLAAWEAGLAEPAYPAIDDDEVAEALLGRQVAMMDARGIDVTLFSPQASAQGHHLGDAAVSLSWARRCNDLVYRATQLFPGRFVGVCQLPQSPGVPPGEAAGELRRCVEELGFVGCNLNPDPTGGTWQTPALTDRWWYPFYETMVELDVPAMVHVSASAVPSVHTTGAAYLNADTTAFMQLLAGDLFSDLPELRLVLPHGGGAAPFHWGRYRGLAAMLGRPDPEEALLGNLWFDTCVYHQPGIDLLTSVVPHENLLFGSEMIGAVRVEDPRTGHHYDDTLRYVRAAGLDAEQLAGVLAGNARRVYPRARFEDPLS